MNSVKASIQLACIGAVALAALGCGDNRIAATSAKLQSATSVNLSYMMKKREKGDKEATLVNKSMQVTKTERKRALLSTLQVYKIEDAAAPKVEPLCIATLGWDNGSTLELLVVGKDMLALPKEGKLIALNDSTFYDKLCELIGKEEGRRKFDLITEMKPEP